MIFEPPKPVTKDVYLCDKKFHIESFLKLYKDDICYGLVYIRGDKYEMYKINGTLVEKLSYKKVELPKNHNNGGQSQGRMSRIRDEKIHNYIQITLEECIKQYSNDVAKNNIKLLILAGFGDKFRLLYNEICKSSHFISIKNNIELLKVDNKLSLEDIIIESREISKKYRFKYEMDILNNVEKMLNKGDSLLEYGKKEVEKLLCNQMLKQLIMFKNKINDKIIEKCLNVGCELIEIPEECDINGLLKQYQYFGIKWY